MRELREMRQVRQVGERAPNVTAFEPLVECSFVWILSSSRNADIYEARTHNTYGLLSYLSHRPDNRMPACLSLGMYSVQQPPPPAPTITTENQAVRRRRTNSTLSKARSGQSPSAVRQQVVSL